MFCFEPTQEWCIGTSQHSGYKSSLPVFCFPRGDQDRDRVDMAEAFLLEEVRISVNDLLQIMQAYRSKNKLSRILVSSLFKRRQEEAETAIDKALSRLELQVRLPNRDVKRTSG